VKKKIESDTYVPSIEVVKLCRKIIKKHSLHNLKQSRYNGNREEKAEGNFETYEQNLGERCSSPRLNVPELGRWKEGGR
jgi:hypothetical protein